MNTLLRLFFIYLVLMGLIYMIPFPHRMTKEGFTSLHGLSLTKFDQDTEANDEALYKGPMYEAGTPCTDHDECLSKLCDIRIVSTAIHGMPFSPIRQCA